MGTKGSNNLRFKIKIFLVILPLLIAYFSLGNSIGTPDDSILKIYNDSISSFLKNGSENQIERDDRNSPPEIPIKPFGPISLEMGVEYIFTSKTNDKDDDRIRYRFDWGDGSLSNWTDFVISNISISKTHAWNSISEYNIRVISQDITGKNSSWSQALNVKVSQINSEGMPSFSVICDGEFSNYIRNSKGNIWDTLGCNIQHAIWDLNSTDGGMVWVGNGVNLSSPIRLRDNVILDFENNQVILTDDIEFVNVTAIKYSIVKNVQVEITNKHTASIIKLYTPPGGNWSDRISYNIFENIHIKNPSKWIPHFGRSEHNYTGIHLELEGSNILYNTFKNIQMFDVGVGIHLGAGQNATSYGNGNLFENIWIGRFITAILFDVDSSPKGDFNKNVFFHVKAQSAKFSKYGVYNISGNGNHFDHCHIWDWWIVENPGQEWSINSHAQKTYICAHRISDIYDEGKGTMIQII